MPLRLVTFQIVMKLQFDILQIKSYVTQLRSNILTCNQLRQFLLSTDPQSDIKARHYVTYDLQNYFKKFDL